MQDKGLMRCKLAFYTCYVDSLNAKLGGTFLQTELSGWSIMTGKLGMALLGVNHNICRRASVLSTCLARNIYTTKLGFSTFVSVIKRPETTTCMHSMPLPRFLMNTPIH
ncbi:hypothetical protein B0T14DRAFT_132941 [Immersiella caudata]|uniref:Uncharacterized protein n=1 Tax=Immersiella caudata TaxID=314043 RepID=A0AA39X4P1_9PEZI|nr:hypothetical protein B0T14DRAFT_132941 [Immersiella caudata]